MIYKYDDLLNRQRHAGMSVNIKGVWHPARPRPAGGFYGFKRRVHAAWAVFTGKADAFIWPGNQ